MLETFGVKLVMTWWSAIFATTVVIFPLMYRTVRGAFEAFDETLAYSGQTLGLSNAYIFWLYSDALLPAGACWRARCSPSPARSANTARRA